MDDEQSLQEKKKYDIIWREYPKYRECSPGEDFVSFFFEGFQSELRPGQTLIDFGCGTARVANDFISKGLHVTLVDISRYSLDEQIRHLLKLFSHQLHFVQACLWQLPSSLKPGSWIYCCDVLEHLPESHIDTVLKEMEKRMKKGGYFSICLQEDLTGKKLGHSLHLTIKDKSWWEEKLQKFFTIAGEDFVAKDLYFNCRVIKKSLHSPYAKNSPVEGERKR